MGATGSTWCGPSRRWALAALVAVTLLVAACTDDGEGSGGPTTEAPTRGFAAVESAADAVRIDTGDFELTLTLAPFGIAAGGAVPFLTTGPSGLFVVRAEGDRDPVVAATVSEARAERVVLDLRTAGGATGELALTGGGRTVGVDLDWNAPADGPAPVAWGLGTALADGEAIYGLTERIVDSLLDSEIEPKEVGSLDRRGEVVSMWVTPTMSGYAPFHQSSAGYGLLVEGTMPGTYDIGATDPAELVLEFELPLGGTEAGFVVFRGPGHGEVLEAYTARTGRPVVPPAAALGHWRGRDEYPVGPTATWRGVEMNATVAADLQAYDDAGLPPGIFHFDRPWAVGQEGYGDLRFDPARFPNAEAMLAAMREAGWRIQVWASPWAIDAPGAEAAAAGYLAPGSERALDLTNPDAVAWLQDRLRAFLTGPEGRHVDGFFLDRGDEPDVSSEETDLYADGRTGREIHNAYPVLYVEAFAEVLDELRADTGWLIARPGYTGSQAFTLRWGGDTHSRNGVIIPERPDLLGASTDLGLRSVLISMQRAAFMGTPWWGSDIGGYSQWTDPEVYARWIEIGAVSGLMRFHGQGAAPWDLPPGPERDELQQIYERYVGLRAALEPYLEELAAEAAATGVPAVRPLVFVWPDEAGARDRWDEYLLGPDLLVAPVWRSGARQRDVWFPPGTWIDVWDPDTVIEGPTTRTVDVPLDHLPLYARQGAPVLDALAPVTGR